MPKHIILLLLTLIFTVYVSDSKVFSQDIESSNFLIKGDTVSAGAGTGSSTNYGLTADLNPFSDLATSTNYRQEIGYNPRIRANTPYPPTLSNSQNYYDRLLVTLSVDNNPEDTIYALIISNDNFSTFSYVQNDGTLGSALGVEDYRTYESWGGVSGSFILGLAQSSAYKVRAKALNGDFTETEYSNDSNEENTTVPFVNMALNTSLLNLGILNVNSISQTTSITVRVNTNGYTGYQVYISGQGNGAEGGLYNGVSSLIPSNDMTLLIGVEGYGAQANSATAAIASKYDLIANNIGKVDVVSNTLASNAVAVTDEETYVLFKASMAPTTIAGNYTDVVYFTVTPNL